MSINNKKYPSKNNARRYSAYLLILLLIFSFRVGAQLTQLIYPLKFLPSFDTWQSGALPYFILLPIQFIMILLMSRHVWRFYDRSVIAKFKTGVALLVLGVIYFIVMIIRMISGQTFATDHYWLNAPLPTFFHFVLASYVFVWGWYHYKHGKPLQGD